MKNSNYLFSLLAFCFLLGTQAVQAEGAQANPVIADAFGGEGAGGMEIYEHDKREKKYPIYHHRERRNNDYREPRQRQFEDRDRYDRYRR